MEVNLSKDHRNRIKKNGSGSAVSKSMITTYSVSRTRFKD